jgi:hypothetical protein
MKKPIKIILVILGILALVVIVWALLIVYFYTGTNPYIPDPIYSLDGSKVIVPMVNFNKEVYDTYLLVQLEVQDASSGEILYHVQTRASHRMRWSVHWIDDKTFQLDSSDIGSFCWKEDNDIWEETGCPNSK